MTLRGPVAHRRNNFDFLRIVAAFCVLISHQHALTGQPEPSVLGAQSLGGFGVLVFFAISGFLVSQSWQQDPCLWRFAARRLLRIWPGFAVVILLVSVVLGPLVSTLPPRDYYQHPGFVDYFFNLLFRLRDGLPVNFTGSAIPHASNGSLWSIPLELACYVALAGAGVLGLLRRAWALPMAALLSAAVYFFAQPYWLALTQRAGLGQEFLLLAMFGNFFLAGAAASSLALHQRPHVQQQAIALSCVLLGLAAYLADQPLLAIWCVLPVIVSLFGNMQTPLIRHAGHFGDLSFGVYIYAFPVQQTLIWLYKDRLSWLTLLAACVAVTLGLAWLSWHAVEKWALQLKPQRPA